MREASQGHSTHDVDAGGGLHESVKAVWAATHTAIPIRDPATRVFLLSQLIAQLEGADPAQLTQVVAAGVAPGLLDKLRQLTLSDITRFAAGSYGLSVSVDSRLLGQDLQRIERAREDRTLYEDFVRAGASPRLVARLFGVADTEVRRLRRLIAPQAAAGGRPQLPDDDLRQAIRDRWLALERDNLPERQRYWRLSRQFPKLPIAALEYVLDAGSRAGQRT